MLQKPLSQRPGTIVGGRDGLSEVVTRLGEAVLVDGVDIQSARRAHMRELTTARQAVERARLRPLDLPPQADSTVRRAAQQKRREEAGIALAHIEAAHQEWLDRYGATETPLS